MKKYLILLLAIFAITGCNNKQKETVTIPDINENIITPYIDDNPIKVGLYNNNKLIKTYKTSPEYHKDIAVFNVYYTNQETVENIGIKYNFNKYYKQYKNIDKYKIGFYITYKAEGKIIEQTILDPSKMHVMDPYLYVYLYDDINQKDNTWYSHLEEKEMKEDAIISSIKLFFANKPKLIEFPIELTVFTYKSDNDFTADNKYRGNSFYKIKIIN